MPRSSASPHPPATPNVALRMPHIFGTTVQRLASKLYKVNYIYY